MTERRRTFMQWARGERPPLSLVSSAEQVDLNDESAIQAVLKRSEKWQEQTFDAYDACGEVNRAVDTLADLMSRVVLFAAEKPKDRDAEPLRTDNPAVVKTMERLGSVIEVGDLLADFTRQMLLPAECWLVGIQPGDSAPHEAKRPVKETWTVYSIFEFESDGKAVRIVNYRNNLPLTLSRAKGDTWIRMWRPHPKHRQKAGSALRPLLDNIEELMWWNYAAKARAQSRLTDSGLLAIPSNIELPAEQGEPVRMSGSYRLIKRLFDTALRTIQNPGTAGSVVPTMFTYPWNDSGKSGVEHITLNRPNDDLIEKRTDRNLRRIAQGFPLPVESFFGLSESTHWTGGTIEDAKFRENVEPFVIFAVNAFTTGWLLPILRDPRSGVSNPNDFLIWYDPSNLIVHPDMPQAADKGVEFGIISDDAWIRVRGFSERDKATDEERAKRIEWWRAQRGREEIAPRKTDDPSSPEDITQPDEPSKHPAKEMPTPALRTKGQQVTSSANGSNGNGHHNGHNTDLGQRLAEIDHDLLLRLRVMADAAMRRALERAGNKLKSRANKNPKLRQVLRGVSSIEVAPTLGREAATTLGTDDLFDDAFTEVPQLFSSWCDKAIDAALDAAAIPVDAKNNAAFQLAYSTDQAGEHLTRSLRELAAALLFSPGRADTVQPESDDLLIPAHLIRSSLARAGGGTKPNLLLATGQAMNTVLSSAGHFAQSHRWWYPVAPRSPYSAHKQLDGQTFDISSHLHQPADVSDCQCLAVPVFD